MKENYSDDENSDEEDYSDDEHNNKEDDSQNSPKPLSKLLQLTPLISILIVISTGFSFMLQGSAYFVFITSPFNIFFEQNVFGNFVILLLILATTETYLRSTNRDRQADLAFISSILSHYVVSIYLILTTNEGVAGTSIMGFSLLLFLIVAIIFDIAEWIKIDVFKERNIIALILAGAFASFVVTVLYYLIDLLFTGYITGNGSVYLHLWGGLVSLLVFAVLIKVKVKKSRVVTKPSEKGWRNEY
ncbi:MAG: hypothetical protein ABSD68_01100 [Candidatus Micrarchaeales archaeon]|jgi:hypothetical protein